MKGEVSGRRLERDLLVRDGRGCSCCQGNVDTWELSFKFFFCQLFDLSLGKNEHEQ